MKRYVISILVKIFQAARRIHFYSVFRTFRAYTMIPSDTYVNNLELCRQFKNIQGDIVECGTWRGGMIAGMVDVFGLNRNYFLFDSFEGLPDAKAIDGQEALNWQADKSGPDYFNNCQAGEKEANDAMKQSRATRYFIVKGWFNESLPNYEPTGGVAVLRLDADWYDSTMDCLKNVFPKINQGGIVILDDYYKWEGCSRALHDYLSINKLPYRIRTFKDICYLIKH